MLNMCDDHGEFLLPKSCLVINLSFFALADIVCILINEHMWETNFLLLRSMVLAVVSTAIFSMRENINIIHVTQIQTIFKKHLSFNS